MCLLVLNFLLLSYNINVFIDVFIVVLAFYNEKIVFVLHRNLMIIYFVFFNEHLVLHKKYKQNALNACPPQKRRRDSIQLYNIIEKQKHKLRINKNQHKH